MGERVFQNLRVCGQDFPSLPSSAPSFHLFALAPFFARPECEKLLCAAEFRWPRTGTLATQSSLLKVCIRNFTVVAGFPLCQYTFQYTSCILRETGGILRGTWKVCIRNFTVVVRFLLVQATCQYTICILGESRGILNVVWKESVLISYIL